MKTEKHFKNYSSVNLASSAAITILAFAITIFPKLKENVK